MKFCKAKLAFSLVELSIVLLVIGILVVGISKGSSIISNARLKTARNLTASSPVNSMDGLVFWLDATDITTIATGTIASSSYEESIIDNEFVVRWKDRSPQNTSAREVSAPATENRPKFIQNGINNLPSISFDGAANPNTDFLSTTPGIIPASTSSYSMAAVFSINNTGQPGMIFSQGGTCAGENLGMLITTSLAYIACGVSGTADIASGLSSIIQSAIPAYALINVDKNKTSGQMEFHIYKQSDQKDSPIYPLNSDSFSVGNQSFNGSFPFAGKVSEIILFNRSLKSFEIEGIKDYFATKYNIKK